MKIIYTYSEWLLLQDNSMFDFEINDVGSAPTSPYPIPIIYRSKWTKLYSVVVLLINATISQA